MKQRIWIPFYGALVAASENKPRSFDGVFDAGHCTVCQGLQYCTAMNGKLFFDPVLGYTREATAQLEKQGVCEDLDKKTFELSRFGNQFQFKDTPQCHQLVWNYHCLSWVSTTFQRVINGTAVHCDLASASAAGVMPLPPCRSLCVEVADRCVYSHFYRTYLENVCGNVPCVREEEELPTKTTVAKKQWPCVKGAWESPTSNFSRCSIRAYEPPRAQGTSIQMGIISLIIISIVLLTLECGVQ